MFIKETGALKEKAFERVIDKLDKKLSTKAFIISILFIELIKADYDNGILYESIYIMKVSWIIAIALYLVYRFIIKKRVEDFKRKHDDKIYDNYRYSIDGIDIELVIYHNKKCILWGEEPNVTVRVINKGKEWVDNVTGYIDLYRRDICIIHEKIEIDYILPGLGFELKVLEGDKAYSDWDNAVFICTSGGHRKEYAGPKCYPMPDIDYYLIKNKTWHVIKELFCRFLVRLKWIWDGRTKGDRIDTSYKIGYVKKYMHRFLLLIAIVVVSVLLIFLCVWIIRELILCGYLHINTYLVVN